jgi:hypothetical protein
MSTQRQSFSWLFSSNPVLGATSISPDGSSFTAVLPEAFQLPQNATNVTVEVNSATIWYNTFNVTEKNNQFRWRNVGSGAGFFTLFIPPGLYSFDGLAAELYSQLSDGGNTTYRLVANQPNQRVYESFVPSQFGIIQTWWPEGTFYDILGFDLNRITTYPNVVPAAYAGNRTARFNTVDYYLLHSSLVSRGIRTNGTYLQVIAQVPINAPPGAELLYEPQNPVVTPANELIGAVVSQVTTLLTDSNNNPVDTQGEAYTVGVVIRWSVPVYQ